MGTRADQYPEVGFSVAIRCRRNTVFGVGFSCYELREPAVRAWLRLFESHLLCDRGVEHPHRKKSGQSPVLETLRNDRVACLRFRRAECHVDGFAETLRR